MIFLPSRQQRLSGNKKFEISNVKFEIVKPGDNSSGFYITSLFGLNFGFENNGLNLQTLFDV